MPHVLSTKTLQGAEQLVLFKKGALEFATEILDKYTNNEFLKFLSKTELLPRYLSQNLITTITTSL